MKWILLFSIIFTIIMSVALLSCGLFEQTSEEKPAEKQSEKPMAENKKIPVQTTQISETVKKETTEEPIEAEKETEEPKEIAIIISPEKETYSLGDRPRLR